jgi:Na+-transporting NADH:ubiquinone oxidoreductase subunit C
MQREGIFNTFLVSTLLCLVCSLLVSGAAILLRKQQVENVELFRKRNVLQVVGMDKAAIENAGGVAKAFADSVTDLLIDLKSGEVAIDQLSESMKLSPEEALVKFDPIKAAKNAANDPSLATVFNNKREDVAGLGVGRENFAHVYRYQAQGQEPVWIFPIRGRGLWSTLKGFVALESDLQTVVGLTFYEHAETPGLGGEVDNPNWKQKWIGKKVFGPNGEVKIEVLKGSASPTDEFAVDGLSGATITSKGVSNMLDFWLGPQGFGPFIQKQGGQVNPQSVSLLFESSFEGVLYGQ